MKRLEEHQVAKLLRNGYSYKDIALLEQTQTSTSGVKPKMTYAQRHGHSYKVTDDYRAENPNWDRSMQPNWYLDYGTDRNPAPEGWNDPTSPNFDYMAKENLRTYLPGKNAQAIDDESAANWQNRDYVSDNPYVNKQMNYRRDVQDAGWTWKQNDPNVDGSGGMYIPTDFKGSVYDYKMTGGDSPSYGGFDAWQDRGGHESTTTWRKPTATTEADYLANIKPAASNKEVNTWMEGKTTKKLTENQVSKLLEHGYSYKDITLLEQSLLSSIGDFLSDTYAGLTNIDPSPGSERFPEFPSPIADYRQGSWVNKYLRNNPDASRMQALHAYAEEHPNANPSYTPGNNDGFLTDKDVRQLQKEGTKRLSEKQVAEALKAGYSYTDIALFEQNQDESPANPGTGQYNLQPGDDNLREQDYDGDGEVESGSDEWKGSRDKAIKKAMQEKQVFYTDDENRIRKFDDAR